ncbi:DNA-processing protein DprA [Rhodococcus sp. X156]|uniref:DNA-processing protein DprA n=1 Tax=Rhodococcus sp. X156 TaxID=2499145 RepID=UPI000FD8FBDF|nr:DNA-processing protein DprA [Rhodococcus sp. X156]
MSTRAVDSRLRDWAYLSGVAEAPCAPLSAFVAEVGPEQAARALRERTLPPALDGPTQSRRHRDTVRADLDLLAVLGGRLVTPDDEEWPSWRWLAFSTATATGVRDAVAPLALWVLGTAPVEELTRRAVAMVGTRAASGYGEHVTAELTHDLVAEGWTIVSGAAYGIDGAAHRAALAAGGRTVAVLACGVDRAYPAGHAPLLREIAREGLVLSEYPPGTTPAKHRFLARNRLVAGLADGVVVVEAGWRSGARNTATWARHLGRPVLAVPGPVTALSSAGCHRMIRTGEAVLATSAAEVIEEAGRIGELAGPRQGELDLRPTDGLDRVSAQVLEAFPARGAVNERQLAQQSGLPLAQVRGALPLLEMAGLAEWTEQGWNRAR